MEDLLNSHYQQHYRAHFKRLLIATFLIAIYSAIEILGGLWSGSLTLLSDAGHTAADVIALGFATLAAWISGKPLSNKHTYGFGRAEVIAAWCSSLLLIAVITSILIEAIHRLGSPHSVNGSAVMLVAAGGFFVNLIMALLLSSKESSENLNIKSSLLHVLGDLLGCFIVLISGALVHFTHWQQIDVWLSIAICLLILSTTVHLLRESMLILMEGVPKQLDVKKIEHAINNVEGIMSVHDIHVWTLTSSAILLTAHVVLNDLNMWPQISYKLQLLLKNKFAITHATLQPENNLQNGNSCDSCV